MLSVTYPQILALVESFPIGIMPVWLNVDNIPKLVVKAPKEAILAAKLDKGFSIYTVPLNSNGILTYALISAFFDDADEPLVIYTPMFKEPGVETLKDTILTKKLDVYFFDDLNRELLGYKATLECDPITQKFIKDTPLAPFSNETAKILHTKMSNWFGRRTEKDDSLAIKVTFNEALFTEDLFIQDMRPENHSYQGSNSSSYSQLVRDEPGEFQERDIAQSLRRIFRSNCIYLNPLRVQDKEEIADLLVITNKNILFIQAKDSPNIERVLKNSISRKKSTTQKSLKKACKQSKGAIKYAKSTSSMKMIIGGDEKSISLEGREIRVLIVVKELFNDEYPVYSEILLALANEIRTPCIAIDYNELLMWTSNLESENAFYSTFDQVFIRGVKDGKFTRLPRGLI
ncbi:hypothetical protein ACM9HF_11090 [Colwellia sp. RE-S-Sl-9]